jgi:hypothetical protein
MAGRDPELIKALERLFIVSGQLTPSEIAALTILIEANSLSAGAAFDAATSYQPNASTLDYLDFRRLQSGASKTRRLAWNDSDQTLDIGMDYDVVQQVGLETYVRVQNTTGVTIPNGTVVGFAGVGTGNQLLATPYLADGSQSTLYILGVMTHDLPDTGQFGYCTTLGHVRGIDTTGSPVSETWAQGDVLYASPTTAGAFTNVKPTAPNNVVPLAAVLQVDTTEGEIFVRPTVEQQERYGEFAVTVNQTPAAANTAYAIDFDTTSVSNGISIDGTYPSRIVVEVSGLYNFSPNFQLTSNNASTKNVWFWYRKNGTDYPNSSFIVTTDINNGYIPVGRSDFFSLQNGDYIEFMWASNDVNVTLEAVAATAFAPASPACILDVTQVQQ